MLSEEEKQAIEIVKEIKNIKFKVTSSFYSSGTVSLNIEEKEAIDIILNLTTKLQKQLETIKEYAHQEIVSRTETIRDYIDDDKEGNKHIIGELKEEREHWKDIEKILQNKPKEELYMNWWRYGLYK